MVHDPPHLLCDWHSFLRDTCDSRPMVAHVPPARDKGWRDAAWKTPPTRSEIGYVARRVRTAGPKDGNYESQLPAMGTQLRMRTGGADKRLYKSGAERWEAAVGSWQVESQVGRGSWGGGGRGRERGKEEEAEN